MLILFCMRERIELAIAIMKSAALFIKDTWTVLLIPILLFIFTCIFTFFWLAAVMYLYSSGDLKETDRYFFIPKIEADSMLKTAFYVELFGFFWINWFKIALGEILIAGAVCYWYFDQHRDERDGHYVKRSLKTNLTYHLGSVALGSFILACVTAVKWLLHFIQKRVA